MQVFSNSYLFSFIFSTSIFHSFIMLHISTWNKTQVSVISTIINLLTTFVVCDMVDYYCKEIDFNRGIHGKRAECLVKFIGINKPDLLVCCSASGIVEVFEAVTDEKGRKVWRPIHYYL